MVNKIYHLKVEEDSVEDFYIAIHTPLEAYQLAFYINKQNKNRKEFKFDPKSKEKINHIGNVIIGDNCNIGSNTTIDRAVFDSTIVSKNSFIDNLVQIAHNVHIGEEAIIAAQTGIAGSSKIGKNCVIGGQVGIVGHINIGDNVKIQGQSGVISSVKDNSTIQGTPAFSYNDYNKSYVYFKNLPNILKEINQIIKKLDL